MADWACPDGELVLTVEQGKDRSLWLAKRREGIGASDIAALMGESRYSTAFEIWLDKTGRTPDREASLPMEMGTRFEAAVAEKFADDTGLEIRRRGMLRSKIEPTLFCNADRLSSDGMIAEIKVANGFMKMPPEDDGTDPYCGWPKGWFWQGVGLIFGTGREGCHLVVAIGNHDFVTRTMYRDDERVQAAIARIREVIPAWWQKHVVEGEIPEMDLPDVPAMDTVPPGSKWEAFIPEMLLTQRDRLREIRDTRKDLKAEEGELKAKLEAECGGVEWLLADGVPVLHFNPVKGRSTFQKAQLFARRPLAGAQMQQAWDEGRDFLDMLIRAYDKGVDLIDVLSMFELTEEQFTKRGLPSRSLLIVGSADEKED